MTMYKHPISSTTSLSDDDNDDETSKTTFFASTHHPLTVAPAQWSSKMRPNPKGPTKGSPISNLPPEVLIHILKHLHTTRDVLTSLCVSRTWCECSVELLWHKPAFPRYETLQKMARLLSRPHQTFTYACFIRRLNFLSLGANINDDILSVFSRCNRLERLTLVNCEHITGEALARVLPSFSNLVAIDLSGVTRTSNEAIMGLALSAKRLQGINLAGCSTVSDEGILALAENCPLLRRVKLSGLEAITDESVSALAKLCPLLLEIDLNHCELITDISIRDIWTYSTHMREMRVSHCPALTDAGFPAPPRPEAVAQPDIPNPFPSYTSKCATDLPPLVLTRSLEHLRMLDMTACSLVTDDAIEGIISYAPKIRNIVLSKCGLLTDRSVESICRLGRHLHYLHMGHASKITDRSIRILARSCTRLRYVDFANCVLLTDMSVFELSALPKLRRVGLVRVNNLTDEAIYSLAERHATLERIHLSYCDQISVMAIHFLLQKLHKLTHLSLTGIPAFRQPELQQFCREPPKDFNSTQQLAFCVYSGKGVSQLRAFLIELFDSITEMNGTDDTEYEDDDDDVDAYIEEDTPEPDPEIGEGEDDDDDIEEEEFTSRIMTTAEPAPTPGMSRDRTVSQTPNPPQSHEFVFRRDRPIRGATIPPVTRNPPSYVPASVNLQGATNRLNAQILAASMTAGPSRRPRVQGHGHRSMADMLPIIESPNSPPPSDVASTRSAATNQSNGAGFFRAYQEGAPSGVSSRSHGAMTPDLNFAEIGHGRGANDTAPPEHAQPRRSHENNQQRLMDVDSRSPPPITISRPQSMDVSPNDRTPVVGSPIVHRLHNHTQEQPTSVVWPYRETTEPGISFNPDVVTAGLQEPAQPPLGADGRGRSVKRSLRNTLNVAEQYANSLLFGRSLHNSDGGRSSSAGASGSGSAPHGR